MSRAFPQLDAALEARILSGARGRGAARRAAFEEAFVAIEAGLDAFGRAFWSHV